MVLLRRVTSADGAVVTGQIKIKKIVYLAALAADTVTLKDGAGNTVWAANGGAATSSQSFDFIDDPLNLPSGHQVSAISSSDVLYLYG
jgi:hypothetical protein